MLKVVWYHGRLRYRRLLNMPQLSGWLPGRVAMYHLCNTYRKLLLQVTPLRHPQHLVHTSPCLTLILPNHTVIALRKLIHRSF
jgi:hypothetical protein